MPLQKLFEMREEGNHVDPSMDPAASSSSSSSAASAEEYSDQVIGETSKSNGWVDDFK